MVAGCVNLPPSVHPISLLGPFLVTVFIGSSLFRATAGEQPAAGRTDDKREYSVQGHVFDNGGKPLANAAVQLGPYRSLTGRIVKRRSTKTDNAGRFEIAGLDPVKETTIVVIAEEKAADAKRIQIDRNSEVEFTLNPSPVLKLRILDAAGNPKAGALVDGGAWRGSYLPLDLRTDQEGRVAWTAAPDDAVEYGIRMPGYISSLPYSVAANGNEHVIRLPPSVVVDATVTDASTGLPIKRFKWIPVSRSSDGTHLAAFPNRGALEGNGRIRAEFCDPERVFRLRIEADGYRATMTDEFRLGQPDATCAIDLQPAPAMRGTVNDVAGNPIANAKVALATPTLRVWCPYAEINEVAVMTDVSGSFLFPAQFETYSLVVVCDQGFATVTRSPNENPGTLTVKPWAHVEGSLTHRGMPVARHGVGLSLLRSRTDSDPQIDYSQFLQTDEQGRFQFPRVAPGKYRVKGSISIWDDGPLDSSESVPIEIEPGQRFVLSLGGEGAAIAGRVAVKGSKSASLKYNWSINSLVARQDGIDIPRELAQSGIDLSATWNPAWQYAEKGLNYLDARRHWFVKLEPDGNFHISGVPPGTYDLTLGLYEPPAQGGCLVTPIATRIVPLVVPEEARELDFGTIELEATQTLKIGDAAPAIQFTTLEGRQSRLSDLKGKVVFIDFWASWCGPCLAQLPAVQRLQERYEKDDRLVILGLNLDSTPEPAKRVIAKREVAWQQGLLGDWSDNPTMTTLGLSSIPAYVVVAADGTLVHCGTNWEEAVRALESALTP